jgi:hypothetical protein
MPPSVMPFLIQRTMGTRLVLASWSAVLGANKDTIVRATVVVYISLLNGRHHLVAAPRIITIVWS